MTFNLHTPTGTRWVTLNLGRKKGSGWKLEDKIRQMPVADVRELRRARAL